jgi:hypothetical protein
MKFGGAVQAPHAAEDARIGAGDQNVMFHLRAQDPANNRDNLPRSFPLRVDNFRKTLAQPAVVIDLGEPEILKRHMPELLHGSGDGSLPCPHIFQ